MEDRLSAVQEVLDGFRKKIDDIHRALNEQKQYDMGVRIESMRAEMKSQFDRLSKDVLDLQGRVAGMGMSTSTSASSPPVPQ